MADNIFLNEATAHRRRVYVSLATGGGVPYVGSIADAVVAFAKPNAGASAGPYVLTADPLGLPLAYFTLAAGDVDTQGFGRYIVTSASGAWALIDDTVPIGMVPAAAENAAAIPNTANLANLDLAISTRAAASTLATNVTAILAAIAPDALESDLTALASSLSVDYTALVAKLDDIRGRIPAALDGGGNIKAAVQSLASGQVATLVAAILEESLASHDSVAGSVALAVTTLLSALENFALTQLTYDAAGGLSGGTKSIFRTAADAASLSNAIKTFAFDIAGGAPGKPTLARWKRAT